MKRKKTRKRENGKPRQGLEGGDNSLACLPKIKMKKYLALMFLLTLSSPYAWGQGFGKNKVTRQQFDWLIHRTEHFEIYYYPSEARLVHIMADIAEDAYEKISEDLGHDISGRTPLILYKSHTDFRETNIILEELTEGVGGFAEFFKHRIVIPFAGSMKQFHEVIFHELTHIFQYDIIYQKPMARIYTGEFLYSPPIWFIEGMAEYMAEDMDAVGEMVLRNAVVSSSIVPLTRLQDFNVLGSQVYLGYKEGESAINYLVQTYGEDKLTDMLVELRHNRTKDLDEVFKNTIGISVEQFDKDWQLTLKKKYWPLIVPKQMPDAIATQLTGKKGLVNNFKPIWSKSGDLIAYITTEEGYYEIRLISVKNGKLFSKISKKFHRSEYEDMRTEGAGISWSPDGDKIAFIAKNKGKEYLFVLNIITDEIQKIRLNFDASYSPTWAPDSDRIAFAALKDGKTDIYVISTESHATAQLTFDPFDDKHPNWHPKEDKIVYSSEREGYYKLVVLDMNAKTQTLITHEKHDALSPSWMPDGTQISFSSDRNGIFDLYIMDSEGHNLTRLTNTMTGCFNPSLSPDGKKMLFSAYHDGRQDVFVMNMDKALNEKIDASPFKREPITITEVPEKHKRVARKKYSTRMMLDAIFTDFQLSSDGVLRNITQIIASDMMGNHRFGLSMANQSGILAPDFIASYAYLARRANYGAALFNFHEYHLVQTDYGTYGTLQRNTGLMGMLSYPLDRYRRIELQSLIYSTPYKFKFDVENPDDRGLLALCGASYVKDTTMWNEFGPHTGVRYSLDIEHSFASLGDLGFTNLFLDARRYLKLGKRSNFATRLLLEGSFGIDHALFYLGGIDTLRGYDYEELEGTRAGLLNMELRIPFIDELRFGWPFAWAIYGIRGILFADLGTVWSKKQFGSENRYRPWERKKNQIRLIDIKGAIGVGLRLRLGFFSLDLDVAKRTDLAEIYPETKFHFGLRQEF